MEVQEVINAAGTNPVVKTVIKFLWELVPAGIMDWYFLGKHARRNADGTRKPNENDDEAEYRRVAAILRDRLEREGQGEETLVDEVDAVMAGLSAHEAFTFRECIRLTQDEEQKLLMFMDVARAPSREARLAKIRAISQHPAIIKWVLEDIIGAYRRYMGTLRPTPAGLLSAIEALGLLEFASSLKVSEHLQFRLAIGDIKDQAQRLAAILEIINLPQAQRLEMARARGYISVSPVRSVEDKIARLYRSLETFYGQLDNPTGNARTEAMMNRQTAALATESQNLLVGRAVRGFVRLVS